MTVSTSPPEGRGVRRWLLGRYWSSFALQVTGRGGGHKQESAGDPLRATGRVSGMGWGEMERRQQHPKESQARSGKLPEISCLPELCFSTCINEDYSSLPPLLLSDSSQYFDDFYKSREDIAMDGIHRRETSFWNLGSSKAPGVHGGAGEEGTERLKNQCSSLISFREGSKFKPGKGYQFADPIRGAPPQYIRRLSQLAALECETIHQEKNKKVKWTKKHNAT